MCLAAILSFVPNVVQVARLGVRERIAARHIVHSKCLDVLEEYTHLTEAELLHMGFVYRQGPSSLYLSEVVRPILQSTGASHEAQSALAPAILEIAKSMREAKALSGDEVLKAIFSNLGGIDGQFSQLIAYLNQIGRASCRERV